eukprot:gene16237-22098_t
MSVFQLQEWWSVKIAEDEEFDHGCLLLANIDNANPPSDKIVVGSQQGILRIFHPTKPQYRVEDLILEEVLEYPIIQVMAGKFIPSTDLLGLAILHPRKLVIYEIIPQNVKDGRANYYSLNRSYQHDLGVDGGKHFTAFNMTSGSFGGVRNREMIIVQSMDGKIQIFEQSANAFTRQLVDCLLPGPISYIPKIDAFVTVNHACLAECYRYQVLASSQSDIGTNNNKDNGDFKNAERKGGFGLTAVRSAMVEWSISIGESCRQIVEGSFSTQVVDNPTSSTVVATNNNKLSGELLMVCDKSLFLLKSESGGIIQQKRLERSDASCACSFPVSISGNSKTNNILLATQDKTLQVYSGFNLVWAAKTTCVPVHMGVSTFGSQQGLIVTIDETGQLALSYLGTRPPVTAVMQHVREMNYDKIDEEHRQLLQVIRDSQTENKAEAADRLMIRAQLGKTLDVDPSEAPNSLPPNLVLLYSSALSATAGGGSDNSFVKICLRLYLTYNGDEPATNVSLTIATPNFLHAVPKNVIIQKVVGVKATPVMIKVYIYAFKSILPSGLEAHVTASYLTSRGEPRVSTTTLTLPLHLACKPKAPLKSSTYKIILDTEYAAIPLTTLFDDFLYAYQTSGMDVTEVLGGNATQAMGFQLWTNAQLNNSTSSIVSILVSKNAGRYRIQAESYASLYLIANELEQRLSTKLNPTNQTNNLNKTNNSSDATKPVITCSDPIPFDEYFGVITSHFQTRQKLVQLHSQLNDLALQFRLIQKRLLVRFKDKNPTPLNGLDLLLKETYKKILEAGDNVEEHQQRLKTQAEEIECFSKFIVLLASLKFNMSKLDRNLLQSYLCPEIKDGTEQGWEETVDASMTYLLKTSLAKNVKESASLTGTPMEIPNSLEPLKKHLLLLLDRLEKGAKISSVSSSSLPANNT